MISQETSRYRFYRICRVSAATTTVEYLRRLRPRTAGAPPGAAPGQAQRPWWKPVWSVPAAMRAARATIVVPALFALTLNGMGNLQVALFAAFGGFATLVLANFGGTRKDKFVAHLGLAVVGSVVLTIGTLVSGTWWIAAIVTVPVAFAVFFAGVIGPNAASGVTAALLAYVLPVASAGAAATIPDRLAGWWIASAAGTAAVLLLSPRSAGDRLRAAAASLAAALADCIDMGSRGQVADMKAMLEAKQALLNAFTAAPFRPTGLATADQGLTDIVQILEWCAVLVQETFDGHLDLERTAPADRELLAVTTGVMRDAAALLGGRDATPDVAALELARSGSAAYMRETTDTADDGDSEAAAAAGITAALAVHVQTLAVATRNAAEDAKIVSRRASPETIAAERRQWYGATDSISARAAAADGTTLRHSVERRLAGLLGAFELVRRHASIRSVWLLNSSRGAAALAAAVAVADLSGVEHAFWVVLGTLSVLRTNASSTGATALRALAGTAIGFIVGAVLLLAIGTSQTSLWVALPIAVLVASYAPGTAPFAVGQAAFTVTVLVLFNLLVPVGWTVGVLRVEDVALGCAVSVVVGVLFWPRGAGSVVGDDLADAFRRGGAFLTQSVDWALGVRPVAPDTAVAAVTAGIRLDDALRGFFAEQGSKRMNKQDLWSLVTATMRLRLTAHTLADLRHLPSGGHDGHPMRWLRHDDGTSEALRGAAADLAWFYEGVATEVGRSGRTASQAAPVAPIGIPPDALALEPVARHPHLMWVREHLLHLHESAEAIPGPADRIAELRRRPWWR
jgi:uncharacterized membrane protein YccC